MSLPQHTYMIESVKYPKLVFELQSSTSTPDAPIICSKSQGGMNQIACSHSNDSVVLKSNTSLWLNLSVVPGIHRRRKWHFILKAVSPSSNIFTAEAIEGAEAVGSPSHQIPLQARISDDMELQYQIIPASQPNRKNLALQAPGSEGGKITFEISNPSAQEQQWIFHKLSCQLIT
ncbi:hypothetical protein Clacol_008115 [Clathrus columnatus]|uniref:Uncharacterized protein n=1 Tax=Clathrus columnatus TaxID=1419009 RepID=A0AAV5AMD0_9AGAM|nr:hypothetical protein Clacol_008115 [Clathrus columnatus]